MWRFVLAGAALFMLVGRSTSISGDESAVNQVGPPSGFTDTIRRISEARNRIGSYDVTITVRVNNTLKEVTATDGKSYEVKQHPVSAILKMIYDKEQSKFLVARHDVREDKQTGEKLESRWHVFGRTLDPLDDEKRSVTRGRFLGSHLNFFDPLALGLHFPAEFHNGNRFEELIDNYLKWTDDFEQVDLEEGRMRFERRDHDVGVAELPTELLEVGGPAIDRIHIKELLTVPEDNLDLVGSGSRCKQQDQQNCGVHVVSPCRIEEDNSVLLVPPLWGKFARCAKSAD